jgi:hypothetical protein
MPILRIVRTTLAAAAVAIVSIPAAAQPARTDSLTALLAANRHAMTAGADGALAGPGAELLLEAGRNAHFFLIGEEHGIAEVPQVTASLFRALVPHGYRHLAIETGDALAGALNRAIVADPAGGSLAFQRAHWPGAPFFSRREESELLREAIEAAGGREDVLWGLDYDILADRYALRRLRDLAPGAAARAVADSVIAVADSGLARAMREQNPGLIFMFGGPEDVYPRLRAAYAPAPGSEAERILHLMEETRAINGLFFSRQGYESNRRRALLNKRRFLDYLLASRTPDGALPRVMLRFGASHMVRGRTYTQVFDLGSLASELADAHGSRSFHVLMVAGAGTTHAVMDPRVLRSVEAPAEYAATAWARPFFDAALPQGWTVFDLRPLRPRIPRLGDIPDELRQTLYGFDAVVVLTGSGPQHDLELR